MLSNPQTINRKGSTLISAENIYYHSVHNYLFEATCNRFMVIHEQQWVEFNDIQLAYDHINNTNSNTPLVKENKSNQLTG